MVEGFKNTEVGVIPNDWYESKLCTISNVIDSLHQTPSFTKHGFAMVRVTDIKAGNLNLENTVQVTAQVFKEFVKNYRPKKSDIVLSRVGSYGIPSYVDTEEPFCMGQNTVVIEPKIDSKYLYYTLNSSSIRLQIENGSFGSGYKSLSLKNIKELLIPLPPTKAEQNAIATALNDVDAFINQLEQLLTKKLNIKTGAIQELLKPKEGWEVKMIYDCTVCMDNQRVPLNENQRFSMKGEYPYCGANGILDYINDYKIDDEVILIAEDGGYFDEYATRPIAYKMKGKFWVNNHAHILKAKSEFDQDFIFYSLVHKNILTSLASGTRAKLNKSEMYKIEIDIPWEKSEQTQTALILSDMDNEIQELERIIEKYKMLKQGMMQVLLTGKIRLL